MKITLWDKGYVKTIEDKLGYPYKDINKDYEHAVNTVTTIAAISRGKDGSNNPQKRFKHLLKEAAMDLKVSDLEGYRKEDICKELDLSSAGRPLEYLPVIFKLVHDTTSIKLEVNNTKQEITLTTFAKLARHSFIVNNEDGSFLATNLRNVINNNIIAINELDRFIDNHPSYLDKLPYFIVEVKAPYFVFAQIRTHGQLSQVAVSERVVKEDEYWLPTDITDRILSAPYRITRLFNTTLLKDNDTNHVLDLFLNKLTVPEVQTILHDLGYKKEIVNRWPNHMKYKTWIIGGYIDDPKAWGHFLLEREAYPELHKSWVQQETKEVAIAIRELINNTYNI